MTSSQDLVTESLRREWNALSRENAFHYIASLKENWGEEDFFESGESDVAEFVDPVLREFDFKAQDKRVLEIGCGVGRMTFALAKRFGSVIGVDISEEMIQRAKFLQSKLRAVNIDFEAGSGKDLAQFPDASIDFCFSYIVLQHIPDVSIVLNYIREIGRVLKDGGIFKVQVNGYGRVKLPAGYYLLWGSCATHRLRKWKIFMRPHIKFGKLDGWGGVPIGVEEVQTTCATAGLSCTGITGMGTQFMWVTGKKLSRVL